VTRRIHPMLVNDPFGDPGLYLDFMFEKRALLFDLGDLRALSTRKILRLSDVFLSDAHIDYFIGFDQLLRVVLGRGKTVRLYGPAGTIERVGHRLAGYAWNLVDRFADDMTFVVSEVLAQPTVRRARFRLSTGFQVEAVGDAPLTDGVLLQEDSFRVRTAVLDHRIPCLAFALEETAHVNVHKARLEEMGLGVGPWLRDAKQAALRGDADDLVARWRDAAGEHERSVTFEALRPALEIVPGETFAYVVDAAYTDDNARRIADLARGATVLFIEAPFAAADAARAADRAHLTTEQAGTLARRAGVTRVEPFHFSPRYSDEEQRLRDEVATAFAGTAAPG